MATGRINKTTVDGATPRAKDWLLWDDKLPGFGLKVTPKGGKVFVFQYRLGGRGSPVRRYTIGKFGKVTAEGARTIAEKLAFDVAKGIDPQAAKVEEARQAIDLAFEAYSKRFVSDHLKAAWKSSHEDGSALLTRYAVPVLKAKPLPRIDRKDVKAVLAGANGKPATARNLFAVLRLLFNWAKDCEDIEASPMDGMKPPEGATSRDRCLTDEELKLVWQASEKLDYPFGPLVRLLILTGARREEVAGLQWSELSHSEKTWSLPASRAKNEVAASWPLSELAVKELDALAKRVRPAGGWPRRGFLFSTNGETTVSGFSKAKGRLEALVAKENAKRDDPLLIEPWRFHDLRRTLATGMQRLGVRFEVTEAILNHVSGSKSGVAGIYQRHDWGPEKIVALQKWADHVAALLKPSGKTNVVPFAQAKG